MPRPETESFINALHALEEKGDVEPLAERFTVDAALTNMARTEHGHDGVRQFWSGYRHQFGRIRSTFSKVIESDAHAVLVWTSRGTLARGQPIEYRGVSVLTWRADKVARFETFYDSAAFVEPKAAHGASGA